MENNKNIVNVGGLDGYEENGVINLNTEQSARGLGFTDTRNGVEYVRWARVDGYLKDFGIFATSGERPAYIPENVFYRLAMKAKNPAAERFQAWVANEVIPAIRKHGAYMTKETLEAALLNPDTLIRLAQELKAEREQREALQAENAKLNAQIEADAPSLHFVRSLALSPDATSVGSFAKILNQGGILKTGRDRLFAAFRERGYLIKDGTDKNVPKQRYIEMGLFKIKERTVHDPDGEPRICRQTLVTGKGQVYFAELFLREKAGDSASMDQLPIVGAETETA